MIIKILHVNFNTNIVLIWRHILSENGPDIEYIQVKKNIVTGAVSIFTISGNQEATH